MTNMLQGRTGTLGVWLVGAFALLASACSAGEQPSESLGVTQQKTIFVPPSELASGSILTPPGPAYDKRREVWDEERPVPGEDPFKLVGWQWLRSYAQQATVALFNATEIECPECGDPDDPEFLNIDHLPRYKNFEGPGAELCPGDPFREDPMGAFCSGTLIDDNLILTAGHCIRGKDDSVNDYSGLLAPPCEEVKPNETTQQNKDRMLARRKQLRVVFNYYSPGPGEKPRVHRKKDVFKAVDVVWTPTFNSGRIMGDIAILQLVDDNDVPRNATPRFQPAPLGDLTKPPELGEPLAAIGAPTGIPLKISVSKARGVTPGDNPNSGVRPSGSATGIVDRYSFGSQLDVFGGNSGGGVYSLKDFRLISWVHDNPGLRIEGTCQSPGLTACTLEAKNAQTGKCELQFKPGAKVTKQGHHFIPDGENNCWRSVALPSDLALEPIKSAEKLLSRFLKPDTPQDPTVLVVGPTLTLSGQEIKHGTNRSLELLRLFYCDGKTADTDISSDTKGIINAFNNRDSFNAKDDTAGIIKNSRLCKPAVDSAPAPAVMRRLQLTHGKEVTIEGSTSTGSDLVRVADSSDRCPDEPNSPDAVYSFGVTEPTILYADTFDNGTNQPGGTNFDSLIFLYKTDSPFATPADWEFSGCFDDSQCGSNGLQAQFVNFLEPGDYVIGVTGAAGTKGHFQLHLQTAPAASRGEIVIAPGGGELFSNTWPLNSTQSPDPTKPATNGQDAPRCQNLEIDGSPDYQYVMVSCPEFEGGNFFAWTIDPATNFDTVLTLRQGNQGRGDGYDCNDDHGNKLIDMGAPDLRFQSMLGNPQGGPTLVFPNEAVKLSSGSALRTFYVDAWFANSTGNYALNTTFPTAAAFASGAINP